MTLTFSTRRLLVNFFDLEMENISPTYKRAFFIYSSDLLRRIDAAKCVAVSISYCISYPVVDRTHCLYKFRGGRALIYVMKMQKAWLYEEYGSKEVLKLGSFHYPTPQDNQLLVQVRAAALNPIDFKRRQGPIFPSDFPVIPGCDMAGVVIGKGFSVTKFDIGDEVYGNIQDFSSGKRLKQLGTLAQFIVVEESLAARKPKYLSFEEAASLPLAVQTAMEGFQTARFKEGQKIFVVGGAGGVGILVVQLAKHLYGASYVVATTSTPKVELVKELGADKVVDYTQTKYEDIEEKFDFVFDTVGDCKNSFVVAKDDGAVVDITWPPSHPRAVYSCLTVSGESLEKLGPSLESGKLKAVIDPTGPYNFDNVIEAFRYLETGRARGKVVVSCFPTQDLPSSILSGVNTNIYQNGHTEDAQEKQFNE